jgi:esterase/lipase
MSFFDRISSKDKELKIYEGYEHVMCKVSHNFERLTFRGVLRWCCAG